MQQRLPEILLTEKDNGDPEQIQPSEEEIGTALCLC